MTDPIITPTIIISSAVAGIVEALVGKTSDKVIEMLQSRYGLNTLQLALAGAIRRYASTGTRTILAEALLRSGGPLTHPLVNEELSFVLRFESRRPNSELIGDLWSRSLPNPPQWRNFKDETELLIKYFEQELMGTDLFRPIFDSKSLLALADTANISHRVLTNIDEQLRGVADIINSRLADLLRRFDEATPNIQDQILISTRYISEKTEGFVGRRWIFNAIEEFMEEHSRGYFFILGDPGIGKTALAAHLVKEHGYIHHFNNRAEGIDKPNVFLHNLCAQLIAAYNLSYNLPPNLGDNSNFLSRLLEDISTKLPANENCVIIVDALDEVDKSTRTPGGNLLYLPVTLPSHVYMVITLRVDTTLLPHVMCENSKLEIKHNSAHNLTDIADFIRASVVRPGIRSFIKDQSLTDDGFVNMLVDRCDGNFMYLRYVLPEIENGVYRDTNWQSIPKTLEGYYEHHWERIKGLDEIAWFDYKLATVVGLTVAEEPISSDEIARLTGIRTSKIISAIQEWNQFLHKEQMERQGVSTTVYRLYHSSFFEFIKKKDEISSEQIGIEEMNRRYASASVDDLGLDL